MTQAVRLQPDEAAMFVIWATATTPDPQLPIRTVAMSQFWLIMGMAFLLLFAFTLILLINRWRKRAARARVTSSDQLAEFRVLYERGELSHEEFEQIRSVLGGRLRKELKLPSQPPPTAQPDPSPPPRPNGQSSSPNGNGI